jgi:hypothetical protein
MSKKADPTAEFEIDGRKFEYTRLALRPQMKLWKPLLRDLSPVIPHITKLPDMKEGESVKTALESVKMEDLMDLIKSCDSVIDNIEFYFDKFIPQCRISWDKGDGEMKMLALKPFESEVFTGPADVLQFIVNCVVAEFGSFLSGKDGSGQKSQS